MYHKESSTSNWNTINHWKSFFNGDQDSELDEEEDQPWNGRMKKRVSADCGWRQEIQNLQRYRTLKLICKNDHDDDNHF